MLRTDFSDVHQLYENMRLVHDTWSCRDEWKTLLVTLYHKHYCDVDCLQLQQQWEGFSLQVNTLMRTLPDNDILKNLLQEITEVEVLIETITALRCPTLEEKSWREISEYLAYELGIENEEDFPFRDNSNPSYTVKWLLEINIPVYKEKIEFIVRKSEKEKELIVQLVEFKNYISNLVFETLQKKNEFYIFGENKEHQAKIHRNLDLLYSMLGNHYSQTVQHEAEALIKHYEYMEEVIKAVLEFGYQWSRHEAFFDSALGSLKLLTKESKEFASWELQWKKVIKTITTDSVSFYRRVCDETLGTNPSRSTIKLISKINLQMDTVRKGLDEFLERKRALFPRYYFISDEQLLAMFAGMDCKEPITAHFVPAIYQHIEKIIYKEDTKDTLLGIVSKQGEEFPLKEVPFKLQSEMEDIFKLAEEQIKKRIGYLIKTLFIRYTDEEISREELILKNNAQVVLAIDFISWVRLAEETYLCADPIGDLYDWIAIQHSQIKELKDVLHQQHSALDRFKLMELMCQSLYMREKTENLLSVNVSSTDCYEWERIPKICMAPNNNDLYFKQHTAKLNYCYEFLGNAATSFIEPDTEKVWLSVTQAVMARDVVCLGSSHDAKVETVRKLGWVIAQEVEQVNVGEQMNFRMLERYLNGGLYTGQWVVFNWPQTEDMLAMLASHIINIRKMLLDTSFEKSKTALPCNYSFACFLSFQNTMQCNLEKLLTPFAHRVVTLHPPNHLHMGQLVAECSDYPKDVAVRVVAVCKVIEECFQDYYYQTFSGEFVTSVLEKVMEIAPKYDWLKAMKCKENIEYITCEALDRILLPKLSKDDLKVYDIVKIGMVPDYEKCRVRHPTHRKTQLQTPLSKFLEATSYSKKKSSEYGAKLEVFINAAASEKVGIILVGKPLSGKSTLIELGAEFLRQNSRSIKVHRIYHNAYTRNDIFENEKNSILAETMDQVNQTNWIVFDGTISTNYIDLFGRHAEAYLLPNTGVCRPSASLKFISETYDMSNLSPNIVGNHEIVTLEEGLFSPEQLIRKEISLLEGRGMLANLSSEGLEWLVAGLSASLNKLEGKTTLKSKAISLAYPISSMEITYRCVRLMSAIFKMNWESIRDKEKNTKKMVDRFISWLLYWSLLGIVFV
jgi:dynein heavy chain, axonemal